MALSLSAEKPSSSRDLLVHVCLMAMEREGASSISARSIARDAGVSVSSIYHFFDDMEQLFQATHDHALTQARRWCEDRLGDIAHDGPLPARLGTLLAGLIDDWTFECRPLAFAWPECRLAAARNPLFRARAAEWKSLWEAFWSEVCDKCGAAGQGSITTRFFEGESFFHLLRWRRQLDRAALAETCAAWEGWLRGELSLPTPWRDMARAEAGRELEPVPVRDAIVDRLSRAAGDLVVRHGPSRLTHRAVASEAGMSLGSVSNKLRTRVDLLNAAFEELYRRHQGDSRGGSDMPLPQCPRQLAEMMAHALFDVDELRLGRDELLIATARDPAFRSFGAQLRYMRGRTGRATLAAAVDAPISDTDAAIFSSFLMGVLAAHASHEEIGQRLSGANADINRLFDTLRSR